MEKEKDVSKIKKFAKRKIYYIILVLGLVGIMTFLFIYANNTKTIDENLNVHVPDSSIDVEDVSKATQSFQLPVLNCNVVCDYSDDDFLYFSNIGIYAVHQAIDFAGTAGDKVFSIGAGTVLSITTNSGTGTVVKIQHENGLVSTYSSLDSNVFVQEGQKVKKGAELGLMSNSMQDEADKGVHLHFSMTKNGVVVDPNLYLTLTNK